MGLEKVVEVSWRRLVMPVARKIRGSRVVGRKRRAVHGRKTNEMAGPMKDKKGEAN
jgi:hypothetical protein